METTAATFTSLKLSPEVVKAVTAFGWLHPTPIQERVIPPALEGRDILACAQTGTGKTGAFVLPMVERLAHAKELSALVLCPTREIVLQSQDDFDHFGPPKRVSATSIIGGASMHKQHMALRRHPTVVVATPGRLLDHLKQKTIRLERIKILIIDEADRMLDMGFMPQIREVLRQIPKQHVQTMLFSATLPPAIERLIASHLVNPVRIDIAPSGTVADGAEQAIYLVEREHKRDALVKLLEMISGSTLVFTKTKRGADKMAQFLKKRNITVACMHSDLSQRERLLSLKGFEQGKYRVLVATDIVARGIDVQDIAHVVNFDVSLNPLDYVHRIGRTARASKTGHASMIASPEDFVELAAIEKHLGKKIPRKELPGIAAVAERAHHAHRSRGARTPGRGGRGGLRRRW